MPKKTEKQEVEETLEECETEPVVEAEEAD
jgi:hypothetical protein